MQNRVQSSSTLPIAPSTRRLLPARPPQSVRSGLVANESAVLLPRRKAHSTAACETCRKRKVKCNAARPACSYCVAAGINCVYTTSSATETHAQALKRKLSETASRETTYSQIFDHLRKRPEPEACEIVKRIQDGTEPESILSYIRDGDLLLQLALAPECRYRYVFPIVQEMPVFLLRPDNPYLNSRVHEWMENGSLGTQGLVLANHPCRAESRSTYDKPYHAAELVDPLLSTVKPSEWTTVSSDNVLMRKMLANYLLNEYQSIPPFQKDYFLQDMAAGRHSCCSSLLVNAVLALGSMATNELPNRYEHWNPRNSSYQFLAEAKRLWEMEISSSRVRMTTIQAAILLNLISLTNAVDAIGFTYTEKAIEMAQRIRLFGSQVTKQDTRRNNSREFTAWALYNWQWQVPTGFYTLSLAHFEPPLLTTPPAPALPDPSTDPNWYGQIWLRYPMDPMLYTTQFPHLFKAQSGFSALVIKGWAVEAHSRRIGGDLEMSGEWRAWANSHYCEMKKWYNNLPEPLRAGRLALPSHLMLHMNYNNMVYNLYSIFKRHSHQGFPTPNSQPDQDGVAEHPAEIRDASFRHLETLLRVYYLRHGYEHGDIFLGHCLAQLGFAALNRMAVLSASGGDPARAAPTSDLHSLRATLALVGKGLHEQGQSYFLNKAILRTFKAKLGSVEQQQLVQVVGDVEAAEPGVTAQMRHVRSRLWPSALSYTDAEREVHRLGYMVEELELGVVAEVDGEGSEEEEARAN